MLQRLYAWLWSGFAPQVQAWIEEAAVHASLVSALTPPKEPDGRGVAYWACHVVGRAACGHARNATALAEAGAIDGICALIERHPLDVEVHLAGATALGYLAQCTGVRRRLASSGAVGRVLRAVEGHVEAT